MAWLVVKGPKASPVGLLQGAKLHTKEPRLVEIASEPIEARGGRGLPDGRRVTDLSSPEPGSQAWQRALIDETTLDNIDRPANELLIFEPLESGSVAEFPDLLAIPPVKLPK